MHKHITTKQHNPTQPKNLTKISKTPKKFKNPKTRSKNAWMHENEGIKNTYQVF